jgi:hypothetical protein
MSCVDSAGRRCFLHVVLRELGRRAGGFAYDRLIAPRRDAPPLVQHLRNLASIANELVGRPLRPADEAEGSESGAGGMPVTIPFFGPKPGERPAKAPAARRAPVLVYFDGKDHRTLARVEELLKGRGLSYQVLDVSDDEAERSWATTAAKSNELPLVFVAGTPVGGWDALLRADVSGDLARMVAAAG